MIYLISTKSNAKQRQGFQTNLIILLFQNKKLAWISTPEACKLQAHRVEAGKPPTPEVQHKRVNVIHQTEFLDM